jgi:hypothetical protein
VEDAKQSADRKVDPGPAGCGHGRCPRRRQRVAVPDHKGKEADRLVTRIDPGVVSPVAELRGHERQAAEERGQWKTHVEERKRIDCHRATTDATRF